MKNKGLFLAALLLLNIMAGCTITDVEWVKFQELEDFSDLDPQTSFVPFRKEANVFSEDMATSFSLPFEPATKTTSTNGANLLRALLSSYRGKSIRSYCGTYYSRDHHGDPILLSGRIMLPADGKVSRIMLVSHFTIGADREAPSEELPLESIYAAHGVAVVESDYIGYGVSADKIHPYLCAKVTARNVIDMYFAALPFLKKIGCEPEFDDIFLLGFSQGGAVTISTAQELCSCYPDVDVRLVMCGGGPYDICATYDTIIKNDNTDYPCAIPMIIQGLNYGMDLNLDYSQFFQPRMVENLDEWLNSKKYTMAEITQMIGSHKVSSIMTEEAMNKTAESMTDLYRAMLDNSAFYGLPPDYPIYLYHSIDDNVVPYVNATNMEYQLYDANVIYNFGHYGTHQISTLRFFLCCVDLLKKYGDIY